MYSIIEENYLKALFHLSAKKKEVNSNDLSKRLNIKMPTVNSMMKKFSEKGLVNYESYKPITLTNKGQKTAALIVRKHRLTEMFLVEKMGFGWEEVHDIAEQIEHIQSPLFFEKMNHILGNPKFDPHGSPIPDAEGKIQKLEYLKLSELEKGDKAEFKAVLNSSEEFLKFLNDKSIILGSVLHVLDKEIFDGSMLIEKSDESENSMMSKVACDKILVSKI